MEISLLTPLGALLGLAALLPLAIYRRGEERARRARASLRLSDPPRRTRAPHVAALVALGALLGLAAAQPVVATTRRVPERTDAQVFVVLDTSRSMLASKSAGSPTRLDRAREDALRLRDELSEVSFGAASMTDRLLPHLFPTTNRKVFAQTLEDSIGIERPPPKIGQVVATSLDAIAAAPKYGYFPPSIRKRVLVVLTDGESRPLEQDLAQAFRRRIPIHTVFVHVWSPSERIYNAGIAEVAYAPDTGSRELLASVATAIEGEVLDEASLDDVSSAVRRLLGTGPTFDREHEGTRRSLMPYLTLAAVLPLGLVLYRRNF